MTALTNVMLIRDPAEVVASYVRAREQVTAEDVGLAQQAELHDDLVAAGSPPPVIDAGDFLRRPEPYLRALCRHAGVGFTVRMLSWPPGPPGPPTACGAATGTARSGAPPASPSPAPAAPTWRAGPPPWPSSAGPSTTTSTAGAGCCERRNRCPGPRAHSEQTGRRCVPAFRRRCRALPGRPSCPRARRPSLRTSPSPPDRCPGTWPVWSREDRRRRGPRSQEPSTGRRG